jgi:hypothetical protein
MKRVVSILLMGIFFFNWYGYRWLSSYLENRADRQLEARLDADKYDESQLLSIKIPSTHLTYYNSSDRFERVDGQIEIEGVQYKYVKRRLFNDSVELLCIPNHTAMRLQKSKNDFFKLVNDLQHNGQGKKSDSRPGVSGNLQTEYYAVEDLFKMGKLYFIILPRSLYQEAVMPSFYACTAEQPPDRFAAHC